MKIINYLIKIFFKDPIDEFKKILKDPFYMFKNIPYFGKGLDQSLKEMDNKVENLLRSGQHVPGVYWTVLGGYPEGKNPKYQPGTELYDLYVANNLKWEKEKEEAWEKEKQERMKVLIPKYGEAIALKIINKELWVGMDINHIHEIRGSHELRVDNVVNKVEQTILYFEKHKNRLGNDAYDFEITLEAGKVIGWKNRANVATRNL